MRKRLDDVGLGEYVLELHSQKSTRKAVAEELGRALRSQTKARAEATPGRP